MALPCHSREIARVVAELAERVRQVERACRPGGDVSGEGIVSSGHVRLDRLLPERGFRRGTLVEWLAAGPASGAGTLALFTAREAAGEGGAIVVVDREERFYPPAAVRLGIDLEKIIVVRPHNDEDHAWALDQVLRTRGVAAVWCLVEDALDHTLRRWQLAAEASGALGLLVRPERVRDDPSWAELRLLVEPLAQPRVASRNRRLRVSVLRSRGGAAGRAVELEISTPDAPLKEPSEQEPSLARGLLIRGGVAHHETRVVHLASPVAAAKALRRSRGA